MTLKIILALAFTLAVPGYGSFVNSAEARALYEPGILNAPFKTTMVARDRDRHLSELVANSRYQRAMVSSTKSQLLTWSTLGRELRRHGSICTWTKVPLFSWCPTRVK